VQDLTQRLAILADAAWYDASCAISVADATRTPDAELGIYQSTGPNGSRLALLKILLTNECIYDCSYCVNRRSSDVVRARFTPSEVVALTLDYHRRGLIDGLFLSSGVVGSPDETMELLVAVARTLRRTHHYFGYIHLKTIPDCSAESIAEAGRWADRLSVNIEMPRQADLDRLAPEKSLVQITRAMGEIRDRIDEDHDARAGDASDDAEPQPARPRPRTYRRFAPAGQTTQMIIGATPSTDAQVLDTASRLYGAHRLRRVYYTAFSPFPHAPGWLDSDANGRVREHRLYQADWLIRHYGFDALELTTDAHPNLSLTMSPKLAWALRHPESFPVDVNAAPREQLLRIPGIGYRTVDKLLRIRRHHRVETADLLKLRVRMTEARYFIVTADAHPARVATPDLFRRAEQQVLTW
jgi:putative DNA modification/repair radical SAM protein